MDREWAACFGDLGLQDINYSDLFCEMWTRESAAYAKTALYDFMPGVSRRTAVRYVQQLIDAGWLTEAVDDQDRRVRLVSLAPDIETRLIDFLGYVHARFGAMG